MLCHLTVEDLLSGGIALDLFIRQQSHNPLLKRAKTAFDFTFGLRAWSHQVSHP